MEIDIVYFNEEMLISKITADQKIWQSKLFYYKSSLTFGNIIEILDYIKVRYKLTEIELEKINILLIDPYTEMFLVDLVGKESKIVEVKKISNILKEKNELIFWEEWNWTFSKLNNDYFLWIYVGGIADICREIKLSDSQIKKFIENGKDYVKELVNQLAEFNSEKYNEAINENRKIL